MSRLRHDQQAGPRDHPLQEDGRLDAWVVFVAGDDEDWYVEVGELGLTRVEGRPSGLEAAQRIGGAFGRVRAEELSEFRPP